MVDFYFKIAVVLSFDEVERDPSELKQYVEQCGMTVKSFALAKVKKSDDDDYPEIEECIYDVHATKECENTTRIKSCIYEDLCKKWKEITAAVTPTRRPILMLYENNSFANTRISFYEEKNLTPIIENVMCDEVSFGVLSYSGINSGCFLKYTGINAPSDINVQLDIHGKLGIYDKIRHRIPLACFHHDVRSFHIKYSQKEKEYKMKVSYNNIRKIFVDPGTHPCKIFFDLCNPPLLYLDVTNEKKVVKKEFFLRVCKAVFEPHLLAKSNVMHISVTDPILAEKIIRGMHYHCSKKPIFYCPIEVIAKHQPYEPHIRWKQFGSAYLMTAIIQRSFTAVEQAADELDKYLSILQFYCLSNAKAFEKALTDVLLALDSGKLINFWRAIKVQFEYYTMHKSNLDHDNFMVPEWCRMVRRVTLTPTRMLLWPPEIMHENRMLRNFDSEYAIRVSFRDENMRKLSYNAAKVRDDIFEDCIKFPMHRGLKLGLRFFKFLAWSNSQLREHGVWMYAKDPQGNDAAKVRAWLGDFSHIHNVPKYMARMGQCFSQTEDTIRVPLDPKHVITEDDIESGCDKNGKPYCFSDGIGKISVGLANKVHEALGHDKRSSAFQIRYGGYKGMLTVDPTLKHTDIVFRKSMKKFDAQSDRLEIARTSSPTSLQLNRQLITILNDMGIPHNVFLKLQEKRLCSLTEMLVHEETAVTYLKSMTPSGLFNYKDLSCSGVSLTTEPFFRSLLLALHRHCVETLKTKASLLVDPKKGRNMLGVLDETGHLEYGQVFIQYTTEITSGQTTSETTILTGVVVVSKNPCLHPGDVRKFHAVDVPELHHIVDCIAFPQKGPRPHPNEMAGSDLDGDEYTVIWDKDLIFRKENSDPAHFPSVTVPDTPKITVEHMIDFLMNYIKGDQIGIIANAHLAHANMTDSDIYSPMCQFLASKFSVAIDFPKTGKTEMLDGNEIPKSFPDFMEKRDKDTYKSKKALGKMYRVCKDFENENKKVSIGYPFIKPDPQLAYPGWNDYKESAIKSRNKYNSLLKQLLRNYGVEHESEAFSASFTNLHCRFLERKDNSNIEKILLGCIKKLSKTMLDEFLEEFKSEDITGNHEKILQKASAWYMVTYSQPTAAFLSFPWILSAYLANIKLLNNPSFTPVCSPLLNKLDEQIEYHSMRKCIQSQAAEDRLCYYNLICEKSILDRAIFVLTAWGQEKHWHEYMVEVPHKKIKGAFPLSMFIKLILHVAEIEGYIAKKGRELKKTETKFSSAALCLAFLKFFVALRFHSKKDVKKILPFEVCNYPQLVTRAMIAYRTFAFSGELKSFYFENSCSYFFEMEPVFISSRIFPSLPVEPRILQKAEIYLQKCSGAQCVQMREHKKKIFISASGPEYSLKKLKRTLRHVTYLQNLFLSDDFVNS